MDLGFNLAQSNQDLKDPTSRQIFGDTSGLLCKNDPILRPNSNFITYIISSMYALIYFSSSRQLEIIHQRPEHRFLLFSNLDIIPTQKSFERIAQLEK